MPHGFPGFLGDDFFFAGPQHHGAVFFDAIVVVAVLADRDQAAINTGIPGVGGHVRQVGMGLRVGDGHRLQAAVHHIADGQQKFTEDKRDVDEQLFLDFHQLVFVRQFQRNRNRFVGFTQLFDDFFHGRDPLARWRGL
ncbi:Uncharacterized protein PFLU_6077 [Pseudomonas [fluorescens] SBW25]|uniref:Uncharacterized protein n=1 Tax=Pseudomonas fluorescens (strain SBW25) TaxID=216595 RepID=C3K4G3_PSEFS|nr:Uncharacterized protein PFLU_6077 [Pseudomonas fluorescens SBW25]